MKYTTMTALVALTATAIAGTMTAAAVHRDRNLGQLDPMIVEIMQQVDANKVATGLTPRVVNKLMKPPLGVQRSNTRLQIKFADDLKIRLQPNGTVYSKSYRSISNITAILDEYQLTLTRSIPASEERIEALIARAQQQSHKQAPDIGGIYWIDGSSSSVAAAASALHRMDDVEWVFWNTVFDPAKHISNQPSIFSARSMQAADEMIEATIEVQTSLPSGACLLHDRTCEANITSDVCRALGGTYLGDHSICESDQGSEVARGGGACCFILLAGAPTGTLGIPACLDSINDTIDMATCQIIGTDPFDGTYDANVHSNGVWFTGEECDGITTDCVITALGGPPGAFICGEDNEPGSVFSGDCYHDQSDSAIGWANRIPPNPFAPPTTFAPGCWDAPGYPDSAPTGFELQICCTEVELYDADCATLLWDAECVSLANSSAFFGLCLNQTDLGGPSGDCGSPWGPNQRPIPVSINGPLGVQRMVVIASNGTITNRSIPFVGPYGCGGDGAFPGQPTYTPGASTPDYYSMGLIPLMTDEALSLAGLADQALLPWPMGGAQVGDATNFTTFDVPVRSGRGDTRWSGAGLNLFPDLVSPSGIGNGDKFSGLYGLGYRRAQETGVADGTHGLGVRVAVLDYAAYLQEYTLDGNQFGGIHEDLTNVLLEGTATGHDAVQMIFNPPDALDYPFDFPQSPNHGTAQLGVIAASWNGPIPTDGTAPTTNIGALGIVPEASVAFFPLMSLQPDGGSGGRVQAAWFNAMEWLHFGDILSAGYVGLDAGNDFPNLCFNPSTHTLIEMATILGISVVVPAGDTGADLALSTFPSDIDPGAIVVTAVTPGGSPAKRWANSVSGSNYVEAAIDTSRNTCAAWGTGVMTCGMGPAQDNWLGYKTIVYTDNTDPVDVARRSYTNNYYGTSAAAAIVAGSIAAVQGYAHQVFDTPISPTYIRQFIAHGQMLGNDQNGAPILSQLNAGSTDSNVVQGTENDRITSPWGTLNWDYEPEASGAGNIVGYFVDARYACIRLTVDPIFDNPSVNKAIVLRGTWLQGAENAIATIDNVLLGINSVHTPIGEYDLPGIVPGDSVTYLFSGETTDLYITGRAIDTRGNPLLTLQNIAFNVTVTPMQAPTTMLQLWMWDFDTGSWTQPSSTTAMGAGATVATFEIIRGSSYLNAAGRYHARFVSISGAGPHASYPIYYDKIELVPTIPGSEP